MVARAGKAGAAGESKFLTKKKRVSQAFIKTWQAIYTRQRNRNLAAAALAIKADRVTANAATPAQPRSSTAPAPNWPAWSN